MVFGNIFNDSQSPVFGGARRPPERFWFEGPGHKKGDGTFGGNVVNQDGDINDGDVLDPPDDDDDDEFDGWEWCCMPFMIYVPFPLWPGAPKRWRKKKICMPCQGFDPPIGGMTKNECLGRCLGRTVVTPPGDPDPDPATSEDIDTTGDGWTPLICVAERYVWTGQMALKYLHRLPSQEVIMDIFNNGGTPDDGHRQDYFDQLLPTSRGVSIKGKYNEYISKSPQLQTFEEGAGVPPDLGTIHGNIGCQESKSPCRVFEVDCRPMLNDWEETLRFQTQMLRTELSFRFVNEYCRTTYKNLYMNDDTIQGPFGGEAGDQNPDRCGGTSNNCQSEQDYEFELEGDPLNWDQNDISAQWPWPGGPGGQGGPNGQTIQMILKVFQQETTGCRPCCAGGGYSHPETSRIGYTTGAFGAARHLCSILIDTNGATNPGTGVPGFTPEMACCRNSIRKSWSTYMIPLLTRNPPSEFPRLNFCAPTPSEHPDFNTKPQAHLPFPVPGVQAWDSWGQEDVMNPHHQGICMWKETSPACKTGRLGDGPPFVSGF